MYLVSLDSCGNYSYKINVTIGNYTVNEANKVKFFKENLQIRRPQIKH